MRDPVGWPGPRLHRHEIDQPGVVAAAHVGLERPDDGQALVPRDAGEERDERAGRGIGAMQVLDDEQDRMLVPHPAEQTEDALHDPRLAALRRGDAAVGCPALELAQPIAEVREQADDLAGGRTESSRQDVGRQLPEHRSHGLATIGPYGSSAPSGQAAARRIVIGAPSEPMRAVASSRNRETPTPAVPLTRTVRARPWAASSSRAARRPNASSRPTYRSLMYLAGMAHSRTGGASGKRSRPPPAAFADAVGHSPLRAENGPGQASRRRAAR